MSSLPASNMTQKAAGSWIYIYKLMSSVVFLLVVLAVFTTELSYYTHNSLVRSRQTTLTPLDLGFTRRRPPHTYPCPANITRTSSAEKPVCTLPMLRQVFLETGYFPDCIAWNSREELVPGQCRLPPLGDATFGECLVRRNISKITVLGDSNGHRTYEALTRQHGRRCRVVKSEKKAKHSHMQPDMKYYTDDRRDGFVTHQRHCYNCVSQTSVCNIRGKWLTIEYVSLEYLWDTEITTFLFKNKTETTQPVLPGLARVPWPEARSTQEFIFKHYFRRSGYPDVILHLLSNHDKNMLTAGEQVMAAEMTARLYEEHVPATSRVVVFSHWREDVALKPARWQHVKFEHVFNTTQQTLRLNMAAAQGYRRAVVENRNVEVFFDMYAFGSGLAANWGLDGAHKKPIYYDKLVDYVARLFCV